MSEFLELAFLLGGVLGYYLGLSIYRPRFVVDCDADDHRPAQKIDSEYCDVCGDDVTTYVTTTYWTIDEVGVWDWLNYAGNLPYSEFSDEFRAARVEAEDRRGEMYFPYPNKGDSE